MSLRTRVLKSVGVTLVVLVGGIYLLSSRLILESYLGLEKRDSEEQVARATRSFAQLEAEVHRMSSDWSSWDDAYAFMADNNAEFVKSNMSPSALSTLHLDVLLFADLKGRLHKGLSIPRAEKGPAPVPAEVLVELKKSGVLDKKSLRSEGTSGFVTGKDGPMLISVRPVLTTEEKGPARGWLVFGRLLGAREMAMLRDMTRLDVEARRLDDPRIKTDRQVVERLSRAGGTVIEPLDERTIAGHTLLKDVAGRPALLISMRKPRDIYIQGLTSVAQVGGLTALAGLVFSAVILFVIERSALSRVALLHSEVSNVGAFTNGASITVKGRDELSGLAVAINAMLTKLHQGEEQLQSYNANLERLVDERTRQIEHQAFHDGLTGLPNRALFMNCIERALAKTARSECGTAALFIDLDNFKLVNDSLGHGAGDTLLIGVAERLTASIRPGDVVARLGGDEFTVLLEDLRDPGEAEQVAGEMIAALASPFVLEGHEVFANGSIGIAFATDPSVSAETLMKNADTAMYRAKLIGKSNWVLYDESMHDHVVERLELETGLRQALERGEIEVHYQPLIDLQTGTLKGAEALARWNHPTRGIVSPNQFIPIAEETGLIVPIGYWILEESCRQAMAWMGEGKSELSMSVNLSGKQIQKPDVVERVAEALEKTGLPANCLKLEITESILMADGDEVVEKLQRLKSLGLRLALDDFGTGYSSLSTLSAFPIDTLKIDRAFVSRLGGDQEAASVVEAIMALSRGLGMDVTGEGIETDVQRSLVQSFGCQIGQGYLFDRPLRPEEFAKRLIGGFDADSEELPRAA